MRIGAARGRPRSYCARAGRWACRRDRRRSGGEGRAREIDSGMISTGWCAPI